MESTIKRQPKRFNNNDSYCPNKFEAFIEGKLGRFLLLGLIIGLIILTYNLNAQAL
jgi:hypothetical protein